MIFNDCSLWDGVSLKTPRPRGWVGAGRPSGCKSSFNKRNMYQYPHVSQLFILLPWQSRVYPEPLKVVEFVQLTTECCWGQPSDPCQRGCLTSHACVMWGPRTLNADDDDDVFFKKRNNNKAPISRWQHGRSNFIISTNQNILQPEIR